MTGLATAGFALLFFTLLMVSVALHEVGHMLPAKLFGVKVPKYFVGFGRTLWSTRRGDTEYGVKLVPLGGFVQLLGMYPPEDPAARQTRLQQVADDARAAEWQDITPADHGRLFYEKKTWQKLIVMVGGITMNLLLAFVLWWGVIGLHGVYRPQLQVAGISACVITEVREDATCTPSDPPSPAALAGLQAGDRIVEFNGVAVAEYADLTDLIRGNLDREARLVVERDGVRTSLAPVTTVVTQVYDELDPGRRVAAGWLGVHPTVELVKGGPGQAVEDLWLQSRQAVVTLLQFPVKVWNVVADLVTGQPRDVYGPISILGASTLAGEVATSDASVGSRVASFAQLLASVNLFLALFNLVPLPPLDGGHLVSAAYEGLRRFVARALGKPDPGHVDTAKMLPVTYVVAGFLLLAGVALIVADIVSPIKLF